MWAKSNIVRRRVIQKSGDVDNRPPRLVESLSNTRIQILIVAREISEDAEGVGNGFRR